MLKASVLFFALACVGLTSAQDQYTQAGLIKYKSPVGFKRNDSRVPKGRIGFFAPMQENYSSNVMITITDGGDYTAAKLGKETTDYTRANDKTVTVVKESPIKLSGKDAYSIEMNRKLPNGMVVGQQQILAIHKGKAVIFTFSTLKKNYTTIKPKFTASLKTVAWN